MMHQSIDAARQSAGVGAEPPWGRSFSPVSSDFAATAEGVRRLADEITEISVNSLDQTRRLIEAIRDAQDMKDLVAIQALYMTNFLETVAERSHRIGALFADLPRGVTQAGFEMVEAGVEAAQEVAEVAANSIAAVAELSQEALRKAS